MTFPIIVSEYALGEAGDEDGGDRMTVAEYLDCVEDGGFTDYDGYGHPVWNDGTEDTDWFIIPSQPETCPDNAEAIIWYNR